MGANAVECLFALGRETAENEHYLARDRVNHAADVLIVEHEVDELSHFEAVDRDDGLVIRRDYQVGLLGRVIGADVPDRHTPNATISELGAFESRLAQ